MRRFGTLVGGFVLAMVAVGFATGQVPFGGFGGGFGGGTTDPVALLRNAQVKKELELTDEQLEKLPDAVSKAIKEVLDEKQLRRFRQIELQLKGVRAFGEGAVQESLKFSAEQKESVTSILDDNKKERAELFKGGFQGGGGKGNQEKITALNKETLEKITGVLTAEQKKSWRRMTGDEFKLETPKGFGNFGKNKNKKEIQE